MNGRRIRTLRNQRGLRDTVEAAIGPVEFNAGPIPQSVTRDEYENILGLVGGDVNYQPEFGGDRYIPHQFTLKKQYGIASRAGVPSISDTTYIPAFTVGR